MRLTSKERYAAMLRRCAQLRNINDVPKTDDFYLVNYFAFTMSGFQRYEIPEFLCHQQIKMLAISRLASDLSAVDESRADAAIKCLTYA